METVRDTKDRSFDDCLIVQSRGCSSDLRREDYTGEARCSKIIGNCVLKLLLTIERPKNKSITEHVFRGDSEGASEQVLMYRSFKSEALYFLDAL